MSRSAASHGVNLMPLLDVLLCTMGTLIVILGVLNREARFHPAKRTPGKAAMLAKNEELKNAREDLELRVQQINTAREKTLVDLDNSRRRLSGIEDSSRQLEDKYLALQASVKNLKGGDDADNAKRDQLRAALIQLNTQRLQLDNELQKARANAANRQPVYAVVPFEGMYKTSRRPIYIECRGDSIILQPEGITFTATDFLGPGGPGNPLASALRAAQEYWRAAPRNDPNLPNEPYPLLLVRPDGVIAYYLVRDAMTSWDAEFGYELVGADWKLDFPMRPEPQLIEMESRAVADARERLQFLAQTSPELFVRKPTKTQYHVSPFRGGAVRDGGPSLGTDPFAEDPLGGFGRTGNPGGNSAFATSGSGSANGSGGAGGYGTIGSGSGNVGGIYSGSRNGVGNGAVGSLSSAGGSRGNAAFPTGQTGTGLGAGNGMNSNGGMGGFAGGATGESVGNGGAGGLSTSGPELASVGPRYAGLGNGSPGGQEFPGGTGSGGLGGGTGTNSSFSGVGNGGFASPSGNQLSGTGNGNASGSSLGGSGLGGGPGGYAPGSRQSAGSGTGSLNSGPPGNGARGSVMDPNQMGGVMLPGSAGGSSGSASSSENGSGSSVGGGVGATGSMAGTMGGSGGVAGSAGGESGASGASGASSGSSGGGSPSIGSPSVNMMDPTGDPSTSMGTPSLMMNMSPQSSQQSPPPDQNRQTQSSYQRSRNMNRQRNWALPNNSGSSVPIQRPIRVECWNDRLVLLPDSRDVQAQVIPLPERTSDAVDPLVSAVRTYTKTWGVAGRGMYWRPQLILEVTPNGEARANDLKELLSDSGWDVKRK